MSWQWILMQNLKRNWLVVSKLTVVIWEILTRALESLNNILFNVLLLSIVIAFELKKNRGVIFNDTEEGYKILKGINMLFENWHEEFDKFWPDHSKVSKTFTVMGSFLAKYILFELQKYRRVIFYDTEELLKFRRKTDFWLEKWHEKCGKFLPEHLKVSKLGLWWTLLSKVEKVWPFLLVKKCEILRRS